MALGDILRKTGATLQATAGDMSGVNNIFAERELMAEKQKEQMAQRLEELNADEQKLTAILQKPDLTPEQRQVFDSALVNIQNEKMAFGVQPSEIPAVAVGQTEQKPDFRQTQTQMLDSFQKKYPDADLSLINPDFFRNDEQGLKNFREELNRAVAPPEQKNTAFERQLAEYTNLTEKSELSKNEKIRMDALENKLFPGEDYFRIVEGKDGWYGVSRKDGQVKAQLVRDSEGNDIGSAVQERADTRETRLTKQQIEKRRENYSDNFRSFSEPRIKKVKNAEFVRKYDQPDYNFESTDNLQIMNAYARVLDPGSREISNGDFARFSSLPGIPNRIVSGVKSIGEGFQIDPAIREEMLDAIKFDTQVNKKAVQDNVIMSKINAKEEGVKWNPSEVQEGDEMNPYVFEQGVTAEEVKKNVGIGDWYFNPYTRQVEQRTK